MIKIQITLESNTHAAHVPDRLFGAFIEHLGRAVYGGIHEPGHPTADENGFRRDVLELVREMRVPMVRYPGGNFVSAFNWEDGVGPVEARPRRLDLAWRAVEPNLVGPHEFMRWAHLAGSEVMMALNLGTRGLEDARNFVEYCNHPAGTYWSDLRRAHGAAEPFGIKVWCLGNEMDGPWQVGQKTAEEYGKLARETAKALKLFDPSLELAACGSSGPGMPTFPGWEEKILELCNEYVDYISLHMYARKQGEDTGSFLAESTEFERFIGTVERTVDTVAAKTNCRRNIMLSVDEWNVWYHTLEADKLIPPWTVGPPLLEDVYTLEDALVAGCFLIVLMRHADRVRMACLAQLVNVIAPIMTAPGGPVWRQTIFYPFLHASLYGRGELLGAEIRSPTYKSERYGPVPYVEAVAVHRPAEKEITLFAVNRSGDKAVSLEVRLGGFVRGRVVEHVVLDHADPLAVNDRDHPDRVHPRRAEGAVVEKETLTASLPPLSWNMIRVDVSGANG